MFQKEHVYPILNKKVKFTQKQLEYRVPVPLNRIVCVRTTTQDSGGRVALVL